MATKRRGKTKLLQTIVPRDLAAWVNRTATAEDWSVSAWIRTLLEKERGRREPIAQK
jgi:hypothetical protein